MIIAFVAMRFPLAEDRTILEFSVLQGHRLIDRVSIARASERARGDTKIGSRDRAITENPTMAAGQRRGVPELIREPADFAS